MSELEPVSISRILASQSEACHLDVVTEQGTDGTDSVLYKTPGYEIQGLGTTGISNSAIVFFNYLRRVVLDDPNGQFPYLGKHFVDTAIGSFDKKIKFVQQPILTDPGQENMASKTQPSSFDDMQFLVPAQFPRSETAASHQDDDITLISRVFRDIIGFYAQSKKDPGIAPYLEGDEGLYLEGHKPSSWVKESRLSPRNPGKIQFVDGHPIFPFETPDVLTASDRFFRAIDLVAQARLGKELKDTPIANLEQQTLSILGA